MAKVDLGKGRAKINETIDGLEVIIPAKKNIILLTFLTVWVVGWSVAGFSAFTHLLDNEAPLGFDFFMLAWLGGWALGEGFALYVLLWSLTGREIMKVNPRELSYRREILRQGRSKEFDLIHVKDLRAEETKGFGDMRSAFEFWGVGGGTIAFDYGAKTYKFANGIHAAEAKQIISKIKEKIRF